MEHAGRWLAKARKEYPTAPALARAEKEFAAATGPGGQPASQGPGAPAAALRKEQ
jgi:hypothetical protein